MTKVTDVLISKTEHLALNPANLQDHINMIEEENLQKDNGDIDRDFNKPLMIDDQEQQMEEYSADFHFENDEDNFEDYNSKRNLNFAHLDLRKLSNSSNTDTKNKWSSNTNSVRNQGVILILIITYLILLDIYLLVIKFN